MTYQEMQERLTKVETLIQAVKQPRYQNKVQNVQETLTQLNTIKENLENKMKIIAEAEGMITTDDEAQAEKLARKGHNVNLKEEELNVDYDLLVKLILGANNPEKYDIRVEGFRVFTGRTAPLKGELTQFFNGRDYGKDAIDITNMFVNAKKQPEITKREVEKRSDGKIKVEFEYASGNKLQLIFQTEFDVDESINEGEGDDHHYIKIPRFEFRDANRIVKDYVNTFNKDNKVYDNDEKALDFEINGPATGDDVYTFYFDFDDKYIASGAAEEFIVDLTEDLAGNGVMVIESSIEMDENINEEDEDLDENTSLREYIEHKGVDEFLGPALYKDFDNYVDSQEATSGDTREQAVDTLLEFLELNFKKIVFENEEDEMDGGAHQGQLEDEEDEERGYHQDLPLGEGDKHHDDGDLDLGHQDDEPHMLKKEVYDIAVYAAKLYKQLKKYDAMDGEVDFPHWWQRKVTLAREYMSKAQHYLEFEEKEPMIDQLALEGKMKNEEKKLTYNDFVQMVRDDMMAGASPDEYPSDEQVKKIAKTYYNQYLNGVSVDKLFEAEKGKLKEMKIDTEGPTSKDIKKGAKDPITKQAKADQYKAAMRKFVNRMKKEGILDKDGKPLDTEKYLEKLKDFKKTLQEARPSGFGTGQGRSKTIKKGRESNQDIKDRLDQPEEELPTYKVINGVVNKLRDGRYVPLKRKVNETEISKKKFKELLAEAYYEVLAEAEAPTRDLNWMVSHYVNLEPALIKLHSDDYSDFVIDVKEINKKPTELEVTIRNGGTYILKWLGEDWEMKIRGERHYLGNKSELDNAHEDISYLAQELPMGEPEDEQEETSGDAGFDDLGDGGGADTTGLDTTGGEEEGGADLSGEEIDFEDEA